MANRSIEGLPLAAVCGVLPPLIVSYNVARVFQDGKDTGVTDGVRVNMVAPGRDFVAMSVKVPDGGIDLGGLTSEAIGSANSEGKFQYIGFDGFAAKVYSGRDGGLGVTATAARVFLTDANGKALKGGGQ